MKKKLYTTIVISLLSLGVFAQGSILYLTRGGSEYEPAETALADSMEAWGYDVVTVTGLPAAAGDYSTYDVTVFSEAINSSDANAFKDAGYPTALVNLEGYTPRSNKWGWLTSAQDNTHWNQFRNDETDVPQAYMAKLIVKNASHPIWGAVATGTTGAVADGDSLLWTATDSVPSMEICWFDLIGAEVFTEEEATVLSDINRVEEPWMFAIESGTAKLSNDHRMFLWGINHNAINKETWWTPLYYDLLHYAIMWVNEEDLPALSGIDMLAADKMNLSIYPNPAASTATIQFELAQPADLSLVVIDALGKVVYSHEGLYSAGTQKVQLDGSSMAPGIYVCQLVSNGTTQSEILVIE